jgi:hypothetical protein
MRILLAAACCAIIIGPTMQSKISAALAASSYLRDEPTLPNVAIPGMSAEWTSEVLKLLDGGELDKFDNAEDDMTRFCPLYKELEADQRAVAVTYMLSAIIKYESSYNPKTVFKESDGSYSIGLFQLTYGNYGCPKNRAHGDLKDPIINLRCGVKLAAHLADRDSVIASGGYVKYGAPAARGLASYWSVMRVADVKSKHHLAEIIAFTKKAPGCQYFND